MRHWALILLAVTALVGFVDAKKKMEELSPNARKFLKDRQVLINSIDRERQSFFNRTPGGKEAADYLEKYRIWLAKTRGLPESKSEPRPSDNKVPHQTKLAYARFCEQQTKKLEAQARKNANAYNDLYVNGFVWGNTYCADWSNLLPY